MATETQTGVLLVCFDCSHGRDKAILIVAQKERGIVTIVNAFEGPKAKEVYDILTTKKRKDGQIEC